VHPPRRPVQGSHRHGVHLAGLGSALTGPSRASAPFPWRSLPQPGLMSGDELKSGFFEAGCRLYRRSREVRMS